MNAEEAVRLDVFVAVADMIWSCENKREEMSTAE